MSHSLACRPQRLFHSKAVAAVRLFWQHSLPACDFTFSLWKTVLNITICTDSPATFAQPASQQQTSIPAGYSLSRCARYTAFSDRHKRRRAPGGRTQQLKLSASTNIRRVTYTPDGTRDPFNKKAAHSSWRTRTAAEEIHSATTTGIEDRSTDTYLSSQRCTEDAKDFHNSYYISTGRSNNAAETDYSTHSDHDGGHSTKQASPTSGAR